jgi:hypothetical protein
VKGTFISKTGVGTLLLAVVLLLAIPSIAVAAGSDVLVFGSADNGVEGDNVASTLEGLGYEVERTAELPADVSAYDTVWYIEAYEGLSAEDEAELEAYVAGGGSLYLTGERPCCESLNVSDENILRSMLTNKDVTVGGLGDISGPFTFNPSAEDSISTSPNTLVDFVPDSPGGMAGIGGVDSQNVFATNGAIPVGAVFDERDMAGGVGRIAVLMDIDWLVSDDRSPIIENIQNFLVHGRGCSDGGPDGDPGFSWHSGPRNCSVLTTPSTVSWSASSSSGGVSFTVSANEVDATCTSSVAAGVTTETCTLANASTSASLQVKAADAVGSVIRRYRVRPKNDPRNVPPGISLTSNWWEWPDGDHDGLPDYWEEEGVWVHDRYLNLPAFGADPDHMDLFLRYDFEQGEEPEADMLTDITEAFDNAPLHNPDGSTGISLHIELGSAAPTSIVGNFGLDQGDLQRVTAYTGFSNSPEIGGGGVPQIFHWMLNFDTTGSGVIGQSYVGGGFGYTAFPVSAWEAALELGTPPGSAVAFAKASNATHELGHQLGLRHHGAGDFPNNDRAYKSVMSYAYSNFGVPSGLFGLGHRIDYSRINDVNLDWRLGKGSGKLTFVHGQWGEDPSFYSRSANEIIDTSEPKPEEATFGESLQAAAPMAVEEFVEEFAPGASPDIPTLAGEQISAASGSSTDIVLDGNDPKGAPLAYEIVAGPQTGSASAIPGGIHYLAPSAGAGEDEVLVRATNGTFSSEDAVVKIDIEGLPAASGPSSPVSPPPSPPASTPAGQAPAQPLGQPAAPKSRRHRCRRGFHRKKVRGKARCVKAHKHHRKGR